MVEPVGSKVVLFTSSKGVASNNDRLAVDIFDTVEQAHQYLGTLGNQFAKQVFAVYPGATVWGNKPPTETSDSAREWKQLATEMGSLLLAMQPEVRVSMGHTIFGEEFLLEAKKLTDKYSKLYRKRP